MTRRDPTPYAKMTGNGAPVAGFDPDQPKAGYYWFQFTKKHYKNGKLLPGGVIHGIRIWYGAPLDPVDGSELDRSPCWMFEINGNYDLRDIQRVWPACAENRITKRKYEGYCNRAAWAKQNAPNSALANPGKRSNVLTSPTYF